MPDPTVPPSPPAAPPAGPPAKRKKRSGRRLVILLTLLVVGLVLLVALLPTIAGTSPVRSLVLSKAQAFVPHGKLDVAGWSLGWFSPIRVTGVKLYDDKGNVVVEADEIKTDLTLLKAVRQNFDLGNTVVDGAGHFVIYPDGSTNVGRVFAQDAKKPAEPKAAWQPTQEQKPAADTVLPDVRGDITLKLRGDVRVLDPADAVVATARLLPGSGGTVRITNINQPIDADLQFLYDTGESTKAGRVGVKASVDAVENNKVDLAQLSAKLDLPISDVDLAAAKPLLAMAGQPDVRLAGVASGRISGELKPGQAGGIAGNIGVADLEASAPQLKDTYRGRLDMPISLTRAVVNGVSRLQIDVGVNLPEAAVKVASNLPEPALAKLAAREMPGDTGAIGVSLSADLKKLAAALPNTVKLLPGVSVDEGAFVSGVTLTLRPDSIQTHVKTDVSLQGSQNGKPISVEPITFTADATATELNNPVAGLRDLVVSFTSAFATFGAEGKSLATLQGEGKADLGKARAQAAQFVDLGQTQLAGQATFDLASQSVSADTTRADFGANVSGLKVGLEGQPPIEVTMAKVAASADVVTDSTGVAVQQIKSATVTLVAGESERQPLIDAAATVAGVDSTFTHIASLSVTKCAVPSFPRLQQFVTPFVPALKEQKIEVVNGSMNAAVDAKDIDLNTNAMTLSRVEASLPKLRVLRDGQELLNDTVRFLIAASTATNDKVMTVDISTLSLKSAIATIEKADAPLRVELQDGLPRGSGTVNVGVDAVQVNRLAKLFSPASTVPQVTAGRFDGKLALASAPGENATVGFNGALAGLTLADTPVKDETYTVDVNASVTPAFDHVEAGLRLMGDYVSVVGKDIRVRMPAEGVPTHKLVENASVDIGVKDLAKAQTVLSALGVTLPVNAAGNMAMTANAAAGKVKVDLTASRLVVKNGDGRAFAFDQKKPVTFKLAADIQGDKVVDGLRITELNGDFDAAQIALAEPIIVSGLATTPTAQGKVVLAGSIDRATPLLAVLQQADKPMPYGGQFKFTQTVGPDRGGISLRGDGVVTDFAVYGDDGKPVFRESQVNIVNDLSVDTTSEVATIKTLTLDMASSKAATVVVNGGVEKYTTQRQLKDVVVTVDAVGQKVWPILFAMMAPAQQEQFKDTKLTGPIRIDLTANGAYPVAPTWNESVRGVVAYGGMSVKSIDTMGLAVEDFALPFSLVDKGKFITGDMRKKGAARFAKPFGVNGGQGDFGSITLDLGDPDIRLSIGRRQKLFQKVQLNPVLASQLGSLASVFFKDAEEASGLLDVTVQECNNVRLLELMNKQATASFVYGVRDLRLDGPVPSTLSRVLNWGDGGILGDIDGATLALKKGMAFQDMTIALQRQGRINKGEVDEDGKARNVTETIQFKGGIDLSDNTFDDYKMTLSQGLLLRDWRKSFPDGATVDLKGRVDDVTGILTQAVTQLAVQGIGGSAVDKLLEGLQKRKSKNR